MAFFKKKNTSEKEISAKSNDSLKNDISKAYDELVSAENASEEKEVPEELQGVSIEMEILKSKIKEFREKKTQESLFEMLKLLPQKVFFVPSVSNVEEPFENVNGEMKLKEGAVLNPALLTSKDKKMFLPVFTDEAAMTQKSPSGIVLRIKFDQCMNMIMDEKNPVNAIVINPFSENMILGDDILKTAFKKVGNTQK